MGQVFLGAPSGVEVHHVVDEIEWLPVGVPHNVLVIGFLLKLPYALVEIGLGFLQPPFHQKAILKCTGMFAIKACMGLHK